MICNGPRKAWLLCSTIRIEDVAIVLRRTSVALSKGAAVSTSSWWTVIVVTLNSRVISHLMIWIVMVKGPCRLRSIFGTNGFISKSRDDIWLVVGKLEISFAGKIRA